MIRVLALVGAVLGLAAGCIAPKTPPDRVMAPSSFAVVVDDIDRALIADGRPPPEWILAGSQRLVSQLADGAAAEVLITADEATMDRAVAEGLVAARLGVVAHNRLVLAVAPDNPGGVDALADVEDASLLVGVCAPEVPCGRLARQAASTLGLHIAADTEEPNVRSLARKISRGELDAGLVYRTDAAAFGLPTIGDDELAPFLTEYPAASLDAPTAAIVDFLRGEEGRAVLREAGFEVP